MERVTGDELQAEAEAMRAQAVTLREQAENFPERAVAVSREAEVKEQIADLLGSLTLETRARPSVYVMPREWVSRYVGPWELDPDQQG